MNFLLNFGIIILVLHQTATLKILVPSRDTVLINNLGYNGTLSGLLVDLMRTVDSNFEAVKDDSYENFDSKFLVENIQVICYNKIQSGIVDLCLVPKVLDLHKSLGEDYFLSESWLPIKPVVIIRHRNTDPIGLRVPENYEYFLHPFYSSVWSLVFLASLITIGLLIVYEVTYPFGYKLNSLWGKSSDALSIFDCVIVVYTSLFNKSPNRQPQSPSGKMLLMFWYMFCVIILFSYLCGLLTQLISDGYTRGFQDDPSLLVNAVPPYSKIADKSTTCVKGSIVCDMLLRNRFKYSQYMNSDAKFLVNKLASGKNVPSYNDAIGEVIHKEALFVTDSVSTSSIQTTLKCSPYQPCSVVNFYPYPVYSLGFVTNNRTKMNRLNSLLLTLQEQGELNGPQLGVLSDNNLVLLKLFQHITPIKMVSMNGPFVFIIIGGFISIVTSFCEYFYRTFVTKEYQLLEGYSKVKQIREEIMPTVSDKRNIDPETVTVQTTVV